MAQAQTIYRVGDRVEADPLMINQWRPATVIKVHVVDGFINGYEVRVDSIANRPPEEYTVGKTEARGIRPLSNRALSTAPNPSTIAPREPVPAPVSAAGTCPSDSLLAETPKTSDPLELSFKRAILANYQRRLTETGLSTPVTVGIRYASFHVGPPRLNRRTLDRVDGTYQRSAPVGADIYPVKTDLTVCERFRNEIVRTVVDGRYECFKDNFGKWACSNASGWKTVDTRREVLRTQ